MTRILADLPDDDIEWLDETAVAVGRNEENDQCEF